MNCRMTLALLALAAGATCWASSAYAQREGRYTPSRPTISPYINLLRENLTGVPDDLLFYERDQRVRSTIERQQRAIQNQQRAIQGVEQGLRVGDSALEDLVTGRRQIMLPSGSREARAATFLSYSRFYPRSGTARKLR